MCYYIETYHHRVLWYSEDIIQQFHITGKCVLKFVNKIDAITGMIKSQHVNVD